MSQERSQSPSHTLRDPSPRTQCEAEEWVDEPSLPKRAPNVVGSVSSMSSGSRVRHRNRASRRRYRRREKLPDLGEQKEELTRTINSSVKAEPAPTAQDQGAQGSTPASKPEVIKLRLDLNLEVDIQLKAKIHGDVTLSLLR